jgi:hypothetical protein
MLGAQEVWLCCSVTLQDGAQVTPVSGLAGIPLFCSQNSADKNSHFLTLFFTQTRISSLATGAGKTDYYV